MNPFRLDGGAPFGGVYDSKLQQSRYYTPAESLVQANSLFMNTHFQNVIGMVGSNTFQGSTIGYQQALIDHQRSMNMAGLQAITASPVGAVTSGLLCKGDAQCTANVANFSGGIEAMFSEHQSNTQHFPRR